MVGCCIVSQSALRKRSALVARLSVFQLAACPRHPNANEQDYPRFSPGSRDCVLHHRLLLVRCRHVHMLAHRAARALAAAPATSTSGAALALACGSSCAAPARWEVMRIRPQHVKWPCHHLSTQHSTRHKGTAVCSSTQDGSRMQSSPSSSSNPSPAASNAPPAAAKKKKLIFPKGAHQRDFRVWLDREKGNKVVTRITEVNSWRLPPGREEYLKEISKALKQKCGAGGAVKMDSWEILVQGDHRPVVVNALKEWGHTVKLSGG